MLLTAAFWLPLILADVGTAPKNRILGLSVLVSRRYSAPTTITELGSDGAVTCSLNKYWGVNDGLQLSVTFVDFLNQRLAPELFVEVGMLPKVNLNHYLSNKPRTLPLVLRRSNWRENHRFTGIVVVQLIVNTGRF